MEGGQEGEKERGREEEENRKRENMKQLPYSTLRSGADRSIHILDVREEFDYQDPALFDYDFL